MWGFQSQCFPTTKGLKAEVSEEILKWHSHSLCLSAELWIIFLWLACLSQLSQGQLQLDSVNKNWCKVQHWRRGHVKILKRLSLSLNADLCIHSYWLSRLRQASQRKMIQSSALRLRLIRFKILTCPLL